MTETDAFVICVNGEEVWRSKGKAMLVDKVVVGSARGEITAIGSSPTDKYLDIQVNERSYESPETYLDMTEARLADERRERNEPDTSDRVNDEGYVAADPETGKPVEKVEDAPAPTKSSTKKAKEEAASDVEF
jgi:hypothetical protein